MSRRKKEQMVVNTASETGRRTVTWLVVGLAVSLVAVVGGCPLPPELTAPGARVTTSLGEILIQLDPNSAPNLVADFQQYAGDGYYDGTVVSRATAEFVQAGGTYEQLVAKTPAAPIVNESNNGLSNVRGSIAMARGDDPDSATSRFFVNLSDRPDLDGTATQAGYAVFGQVVAGLDVLDEISRLPRVQRDGLPDVPSDDVVIEVATQTTVAGPNGDVPAVEFKTSHGDFVVALAALEAPLTVQNFLQYVADDFYVGTVLHRVEPDVVVEGGGFSVGLAEREPRDPVATPGGETPSNLRGTVAALLSTSNELTTAQFLINVSDNPDFDGLASGRGNIVFGTVIEGLDVLDQIATVPTLQQGARPDVPVEPVTIRSVTLESIPLGVRGLTPAGQSQVEALRAAAYGLFRDLAVQGFGLWLGSY